MGLDQGQRVGLRELWRRLAAAKQKARAQKRRDPKNLQIQCFSHFPSVHNVKRFDCFDPPFLSYFPALSMAFKVISRTDAGFKFWKNANSCPVAKE
jgi:hypothetical protein